jgi:hypothetical protein
LPNVDVDDLFFLIESGANVSAKCVDVINWNSCVCQKCSLLCLLDSLNYSDDYFVCRKKFFEVQIIEKLLN